MRVACLPRDVQELIEGASQHFARLAPFFDQLGVEQGDFCLNLSVSTRSLDSFEGKSQVVESLLPESLILRESGENLGGHNMHDRLQEVKETNQLVSVRVQQLHVVHSFEVNILILEVELFAHEQD